MEKSLHEQLAVLLKSGGFRQRQPMSVAGYQAQRINQDRQLINFSSNDYLGLAGDQALQDAFFAQTEIEPNWMSASSSRALTGTSLQHQALESEIASSYQKDSALLFNSGYHANTGILPAITSNNDLVLADKLVHASIIDGLRLSKTDFKRFAHNDVSHLKSLLEKYRKRYDHVWIVTESVFSMDGDIAPLQEIVQLKRDYDVFLYVDEAHAVGCFGQKGLGIAEQLSVIDEVDLLVGVFGKALASMGAFVVADQPWIDGLVNYSRSWLFSTALPPINTAWNYYIWQQLPEFNQQRQRLQQLTDIFRSGLAALGKQTLGETYIVPVLQSGNQQVLDLSSYLESQGFLAMPIRSPTVKSGSERVRFSLTANIPQQQITALLQSLENHAT